MWPKPSTTAVDPATRRAAASNAGRGHAAAPPSARIAPANGSKPRAKPKTAAAAVSAMIAPWNEP